MYSLELTYICLLDIFSQTSGNHHNIPLFQGNNLNSCKICLFLSFIYHFMVSFMFKHSVANCKLSSFTSQQLLQNSFRCLLFCIFGNDIFLFFSGPGNQPCFSKHWPFGYYFKKDHTVALVFFSIIFDVISLGSALIFFQAVVEQPMVDQSRNKVLIIGSYSILNVKPITNLTNSMGIHSRSAALFFLSLP